MVGAALRVNYREEVEDLGAGLHVDWRTVALVSLALASSYREERGYADDTVEQLAAVIDLEPAQTSRALRVLDLIGVWVVDVRGGRGRGTRRVPAFVNSRPLEVRSSRELTTSTGREIGDNEPTNETPSTAPGISRPPEVVSSPVDIGELTTWDRELTTSRGATPRITHVVTPSSTNSRAGETPNEATNDGGSSTSNEDLDPWGPRAQWGEVALREARLRIERHRDRTRGTPRNPDATRRALDEWLNAQRPDVEAWLREGRHPRECVDALLRREDGAGTAQP